ncbi:hypothetical protein PENFLA_c060G04258 [Penicillium flavigenum]|uniref:Zn(2)-C6 fungal-type domain-containing protein n=1 Tax=Penicillium flavigenum TaxID=254877 RepID=A0A1V6SG03_9EURO|nr:hypothetical protein PENFLA_c060G04258 [Penicillium flavigenum]
MVESAIPFSERGKHPKRAKYASKACGQCKRRKIKCDGNVPCRACISKRRDCQQNGTDMRGRWRKTGRDLAERQEKSRSREPQDKSAQNTSTPPELYSRSHQEDVPEDQNGHKGLPDESITPFSGETSLAHNITVVEDRLEQMGVRYARLRSESPNHSFSSQLTPSPQASPKGNHREQTKSYVYQALDSHKIVPDRVQWDRAMKTFCDEVHILVPFLHLPSVWEAYERLWESFLVPSANHYSHHGEWRFTFACVLLCLANGTCVESSRVDGQQGQYSAGWSLYRAARDVIGDLLDVFGECTDQILLLQNILLMVIYLFRLDSHGPAEKLLALSISHSHHIGLQRRQVVEAMNPFESEMARRLWWCIYLMDRRLAIETGRPFLIQDLNVDIGLPRSMSDEWLSKHRGTSHPLQPEDTGTGNSPTTVPYLIAMASYSKVIGKVWEALYGASTSDSTPSPFLKEYLELLITQSQSDLQPEFSYDPQRPGSYKARGLVWWQIKQQLMMRIRWSSLYLLIRKPMLQRKGASSLPVPEAIENEVICMRLAQSIIEDFSNVAEDHPKYTFPFLHYLTSATIIALGLIIKQSSFKHTYGELTLEAARSLKKHCRKTWVSGRMARAVWKLNQMAEAIMNPGSRLTESLGNNDQQSSSSRPMIPSDHLSRESPKTFNVAFVFSANTNSSSH